MRSFALYSELLDKLYVLLLSYVRKKSMNNLLNNGKNKKYMIRGDFL